MPKKGKLRLVLEIIALISFVVIGLMIVVQGNPFSSSQPSSPPIAESQPKEAKWYLKLDNQMVQCQLCFRKCTIPEGKRGVCRVRENRGGTLYSLVYGKPCAVTVGSPIEKLPFYHIKPGSFRLCLATAGCNFKCKFCQNWTFSVAAPEEVESYDLSPKEAVQLAIENNLEFIAFTYNEPTVFYEYMYDIAKLAKERGLKVLFNTNGAMNPEPLRELLKYLDGVNVDLKAFTKEFYQETIPFAEMEPVLNTLRILKEEGVWFEIVNLVIPTLNDDPEKIREMCIWIKDNLGNEVPVHFTRFFPAYKLTKLPPTSIETLEKAREIAKEVGLNYVYVGNVPGHEGNNTYCPQCGQILVKRVHFTILANHIEEGKCKFCHILIPGIWTPPTALKGDFRQKVFFSRTPF